MWTSTLFSYILAFTSAVLEPKSNPEAAAIKACTSLRASLGAPIVQSSGIEYAAGATGAWNLFNAGYQPTCIVFPRHAEHVQTAMKAIYQAEAHYSVQAGGHSAMKGWNKCGAFDVFNT